MSNAAEFQWVPASVGSRRPAVVAAGGAALLLAAWSGAARADFQVCNQTLDVVNVAIGQQHPDAFRTEGWWTIGSNQCAKVIKGELENRYVYVFANDVFGQALLDGTVPMCIDEKKFSIDGPDRCWVRGYREAKFVEVDTQALDNWTLFLNEPGE